MATPNGRYDVDQVFEALGPKGRYTVLMFIMACLVEFPAVFQILDNVFIGREMPFQCSRPSNESSFYDDLPEPYHNVTIVQEQCTLSAMVNGSVLKKTDCRAGVEFLVPRDKSVVAQFGLVCEKKALFSLTQTLVFVGQGLGALVGPSISDRYGRRISLIASNFMLLVVGVGIAYAPSYVFFAVFKLLAGAFQQNAYIAKSVYCVELLPAPDRRLAVTLSGINWAVGEMALTLVAFLMKDVSWRTLQLVLSLFSLTFIVQIWMLDESLRWLVANGKSKEVTKCIKRAARMNNKSFTDVYKAGYVDNTQPLMELEVKVPPPPYDKASPDFASSDNASSESPTSESEADTEVKVLECKTKHLTFLDILRVKRLFINAFAMWWAWCTCSLGFFTLFLTASTLSGDLNLNYFFVALAQLPPCLFVYFAFNRIGRKPTTMILFVILGVSLFGIGICNHLSSSTGDVFDTFTLLFTLSGISGAQGSFFAVFFYLPELFPTNIRNQATGVASFVARIGAILAPFTGVLMDVAVWGPGLIIGAMATLVTILLTLLPETKDRELPQTIEDLYTWKDNDSKDNRSETKN